MRGEKHLGPMPGDLSYLTDPLRSCIPDKKQDENVDDNEDTQLLSPRLVDTHLVL